MWSHSLDINFLQEANDLERSLSGVVNEEENRRLKQEIKILRAKGSLAYSKCVSYLIVYTVEGGSRSVDVVNE